MSHGNTYRVVPLSQLRSGTAASQGRPREPLVQGPPGYEAMVIDTRNTGGLQFLCYVDGVDAPPVMARGGDVVLLVPRSAVYVEVAALGGYAVEVFDESALADFTVRFDFYRCASEAFARRALGPGDVVFASRYTIDLNIGNSTNIVDLEDVRHAIGLSLVARCTLQGGAMDTTGTGDDYPLELELSTPYGSQAIAQTVAVFPGNAQAVEVDVPLPSHGDATYPWALRVRNPSGSLNSKVYHIITRVIAMPPPPALASVHGSASFKVSGGSPGTNYFASTALRTRGGAGAYYGRAANLASVGSLTVNRWHYVPQASGGPALLEIASTAVVAGADTGFTDQLRAGFMVLRVRYTGAPTGPGVSVVIQT